MNLKIDGPFTSSYSLALVNREMALALEAFLPGQVALGFDCHPEGGFWPEKDWLEQNPGLAALYQRGLDMENPQVVLYNSYPPYFPRVPGALCLTNAYGWEESLFPKEYVQGFNQNLSGMTLMSEFVRKTMRDNGVFLPMAATGLGVDHILSTTPWPWAGDLGQGFRFLHVSSCFPRKGLDVLLKAYAHAFTAQDEVTLIIKTFPNPHNNAQEQVARFRQQPDSPEVILINQDLDDAYILDIYQRSHCLLAPSRGEGFGLPMAEAMALGIPVITTGYGGQRDFCTPDTAWLIDYFFARARTHLTSFASCWAEPDPGHLSDLMRQVYQQSPDQLQPRIQAAQDLILSEYTWQACAWRLLDFIRGLQHQPAARSSTRPGPGHQAQSNHPGAENNPASFDSTHHRPSSDSSEASPSDSPPCRPASDLSGSSPSDSPPCRLSAGGSRVSFSDPPPFSRQGLGEGSCSAPSSTTKPPKPRVGLVSTWNCRCGIAEYAKYLLPGLLQDLEVSVLAPVFTERIYPDEPNVYRLWDREDAQLTIPDQAGQLGLSSVLLNFHVSFFSVSTLAELIENLQAQGIAVLIVFHAVRDSRQELQRIKQVLAQAHRLLVHSVQDLNYFKTIGLVDNVTFLPHGVSRLPRFPRPASVVLPEELRHRRLIGSFGFLMPHKGVLELIQAFAGLLPRHPDLGLLLLNSLYPKPEVQEHYQQCLRAIQDLGLSGQALLIPDFLPLQESQYLLSKCSLIAYPYQQTAESSSAAVRVGLGADRPVAVSPLPIFNDVQAAVHELPGTSSQDICQGLDQLLSDPELLASRDQARKEWLQVHHWPAIATRLSGLLQTSS